MYNLGRRHLHQGRAASAGGGHFLIGVYIARVHISSKVRQLLRLDTRYSDSASVLTRKDSVVGCFVAQTLQGDVSACIRFYMVPKHGVVGTGCRAATAVTH